MDTTAQKIATALRQRLSEGGYPDDILPSERNLASEFGVARPTVRRALEDMVADSVLLRLENGRLKLASDGSELMQVGYFYPSLGSWNFENQYLTLSEIAGPFNMKIRPIYYDSWNDPAFTEGVDSVDAVILNPRPNIPDLLVRKLRNCGKQIWVLEYDYSEYGFPSLTFFPDRAVDLLLDYLYEQGFRDVDLVNVTPKGNSITNRFIRWQAFLDRTGGKGQYWDFSLTDGHLPFCELCDIMRHRIEDGAFDLNRLILSTTIAGATIFLRAAADLGLYAGKDYSLASINGERHAELNVPAITSVDSAKSHPYFRNYLQWLASGKPWEGALFQEADDYRLIPGESIIRSKNNSRKNDEGDRK